MNANRRKKNNNNGGNPRKSGNASRRRVRVRVAGPMDQKALAYRQLLGDPCNGPLVSPTAIGPSSGLLVRQRRIVTITNQQAASNGNFVVCCTPSTGELKYSSDTSTALNAWTTVDLEVGILASSVTRSYRCVAACMKWIPTGSLTTRSGAIHSGYILDKVDTTQTVRPTGGYLTMCPTSVSNTGIGDCMEVRWLPTGPEDLEFRDGSVTYNAETGSMLIVGRQVDAAGATIGSSFNGYIEVTGVYEWLPDISAGIVAPMQMGSTTPLQTVLASLGELSRFAVDSQYVRQVMGRAASMAMQVGTAYVGQRAINSYAGAPLISPY